MALTELVPTVFPVTSVVQFGGVLSIAVTEHTAGSLESKSTWETLAPPVTLTFATSPSVAVCPTSTFSMFGLRSTVQDEDIHAGTDVYGENSGAEALQAAPRVEIRERTCSPTG